MKQTLLTQRVSCPLIPKFLRVLGTQLAVAQHVFQREPQALEGTEEAVWAQLELRARAVLQHALDQEVTSQSTLQVRHSVVVVFKATHKHTFKPW